MKFPFTTEQFFAVFAQYNMSVWPIHVLFYLAALSTFVLLFVKKAPHTDGIISAILAFFWLWMGIVYHWIFFSPINPAAKLFAAFFIAEGLLFAYQGIVKHGIHFFVKRDARSVAGIGFMMFGTVLYPLIGYFAGHVYPSSPTFGLPCPTTIVTFGLLLLARGAPRYLVVIPFLWSIVGFMAALSMGVAEDVFLLIAGLISFAFIMPDRHAATHRASSSRVPYGPNM